jgi:hypothetical protein
MDIIDKLPEDLQNKIFYYLSHPCADMIRDRVKQLKLNSIILIEGILSNIDLEFDMRDLFITEHFIKLKCDRQRKLWEYKFLSAEKIIKSLMNDESQAMKI